jgi:hypothetical protein
MTTVWRVYESTYDDQETKAVCATYAEAIDAMHQHKANGLEKLTVGLCGEDWTPERVLFPQPLDTHHRQLQDHGCPIIWTGYGFRPDYDWEPIKVRERSRPPAYPDVE